MSQSRQGWDAPPCWASHLSFASPYTIFPSPVFSALINAPSFALVAAFIVALTLNSSALLAFSSCASIGVASVGDAPESADEDDEEEVEEMVWLEILSGLNVPRVSSRYCRRMGLKM